jgi:hypothetical protein
MENVTPYADNFIPVIPVEYSYHTDENPFCWDSDCPCKYDKLLLDRLHEYYNEGLLTAEEVEHTLKGKIV